MGNQEIVKRSGTVDIIPVPSWSPDELLPPEGIAAALAIELWQRARDVRLWNDVATTPLRTGLFWKGALDEPPPAPESILPALECLRALVQSPDSASPGDVSAACATITRWAEHGGYLDVARTYAETWALIATGSAEAAATAGGICMRLADYSRAEIWLQRAVRIGRATQNWEWYVRGYLRRGILQFNLGNYRPARRFYGRAYQKAVWAGFDALAGKAQHDLMTICTDVAAFDLGIDYATEALRLYSANDPVFPYFVHDFAFLLVQAGHFSPAELLLSAALEHIPEHRRLLINGTMARTAAALGDSARFASLAAAVVSRAATSEEGAAAAFVRLADSARCAREWERAEEWAGRALEIAHRRYEGQPQRLAHTILDRVSTRDAEVKTFVFRQDVATLVPMFLERLQKHSARQTSRGR
ncbi:MAG: tetratricopeptide repeat protein [Thioalkalivibrio sp.]|nr:tetratricopeptide repeat protein [Thioalkalivibrio sp.]